MLKWVLEWWEDLQKRDRAWINHLEEEKAKREESIKALSPSERSEYDAEIQARDEEFLESINHAFRTFLNLGRVLGIIGIAGTVLFNPPGIFALLPFIVAIWGIQLLAKR